MTREEIELKELLVTRSELIRFIQNGLTEKEKKSWSQIKETAKLNSIQTARDYYKAARKLIEEGFPL